MRLKKIIIVQNKIDLIKETDAPDQQKQILNFVKDTVAEGAPIVPLSAQLGYNIDALCEYIVNKIPVPVRDFTSPSKMMIIRSFNVNKLGTGADDIKGGVAGGSILRGVLRVNQLIEIRPGITHRDENENVKYCTPIFARVLSLFADHNELQFAVPGGLIGVGTTIDPHITQGDRLVRNVLGEVGSLPDVYIQLEMDFFLLRRLLGVKTKESEKPVRVSKLLKGELLMLNIGSMAIGGIVIAVNNDMVKMKLKNPVCTSIGEKVALSRRIEKRWRLIGWGQIQAGQVVELVSDQDP